MTEHQRAAERGNRSMKNSFLLVVLSLISGAAYSQDSVPNYIEFGDELGIIKNIHLVVHDEVSDSCWTNSSSILSRVRLIFEQSDIATSDERFAFFGGAAVGGELVAFGHRTASGICVVSAEFKIMTQIYQRVGGFEGRPVYYFGYWSTIHSSKYVVSSSVNVNGQLTDFFEGAASEVVADIISARREDDIKSFFSDFPNYGADPMTSSEFEEFLASQQERQ